MTLRPLEQFGIVAAELKHVGSLGEYMIAKGGIWSDLEEPHPEHLSRLAALCEQLRPQSLYAKYANRKVFRHEADFWATTDKGVRTHVKRMADKRLIEAIRLADEHHMPILYLRDKQAPLCLSQRLRMDSGRKVGVVMNFSRHDEGTTYWLQLRIDGALVERPSDHRLIVLTHEPGFFVLDGQIMALGDGLNGKLLLPFCAKQRVEIPRNVENDYFHRFILRHAARVEINAEGFDVTDVCQQPQPCLVVETAIDGTRLLSLHFRYGGLEFKAEDKANGRVALTEAENSFCFVRQLRDTRAEQRMAEKLREEAGAETTMRFASLGTMIEWLRQHAPRLRAQGFDVVQPTDHIYYIGPLSVEQSDTWQGDWLQTNVTVVADEGRIRLPFSDLRDTILRGEQEYMLPTGELLLIPPEWLKRYADLLLIGMPKGQGFQRHRSQMAGTEREAADGEQARSTDTCAEPVDFGPMLKATLRPYQQVGYRWLWQNLAAQTGCCLSDEMGLGKTLQTIALLLQYKLATKTASRQASARQAHRADTAGMLFTEEEMQGAAETVNEAPRLNIPYRTSLVVAPASVVHNWRNELSRFAPSLSVLTYTGDTAKRKEKRLAMMRWNVVLTTYRTLLNDIEQLAGLSFGIIVFDESQAFKTAASQIHQAVASLRALHRIALSGTPVENNLQELWSLMNVLNPNLLGDARTFHNSFVNPIARQMEDSRRDLLRRLIAPYFLKRTKEEVLSDLPERQEEVVVCPMTDQQASLYSEELSKARNEWLDGGTSGQSRQIRMLAALQRLRMIANGEGKLSVVFQHLQNLRATRHKVLIFSEYVELLKRVGSEMERRGWAYDMLTGQTQHREQVIAHFQQSAGTQFFLISLKAGGVGLNLTAADYVFLLDPWWNRAAEEQAIARAHRIGQQRSVFVYRFVAAATLEEQILTLQDRKQSLIDSVMPFITPGNKGENGC